MSISAPEAEPVATTVLFGGESLLVKLADGRAVTVPLTWYPRLLHGSERERAHWELIGGGTGIEWPDLDEHISVEGLIAGRRSRETPQSLERWLSSRSGIRPEQREVRARNLAVLPCVFLNRKIAVEEYELLPLRSASRSHTPANVRANVKHLLRKAAPDFDVSGEAVVFRLTKKEYSDQLTSQEVQLLYTFSQVLVFCSRSTRKAFTEPSPSRAHLAPVLDYEHVTPWNWTRSILWSVQDLLGVPTYEEALTVDTNLLRGLLKTQNQVVWDDYLKAITAYNCADAIRGYEPGQTAIILLFSAFEALLDLSSFRAAQVISSFAGALDWSSFISPAGTPSSPDAKRTVTAEWMSDFVRLRAHVLHPHIGGARLQWSSDDHVQLAFRVFPLLAKIRLAHEGLYALSPQDAAEISAFEQLAETRKAA